MTSREKFEEWADQRFPFKKDRFKLFRGDYSSQFTQQLWECWQASRDEEIGIPEIDSDRYFWADGVFNLKEDITENIRAAGYKVKGD